MWAKLLVLSTLCMSSLTEKPLKTVVEVKGLYFYFLWNKSISIANRSLIQLQICSWLCSVEIFRQLFPIEAHKDGWHSCRQELHLRLLSTWSYQVNCKHLSHFNINSNFIELWWTLSILSYSIFIKTQFKVKRFQIYIWKIKIEKENHWRTRCKPLEKAWESKTSYLIFKRFWKVWISLIKFHGLKCHQTNW